MGLLVVAGIVALVLTLLTLVTIALVQLVLFVTLRNAVLVLVVVATVWFVDSRRRQVAKGFYSCTEVPSGAEGVAPLLRDTKAKPPRDREPKRARGAADAARALTRSHEDEDKEEEEEKSDSSSRQQLVTDDAERSTTMTDASSRAGEASESGARDSLASNASEAESCSDEVPVAAVATSPSESASPTPSVASTLRLPELRHRKWKHPTRSVPLVPKGESLLQENRKSGGGDGRDRTRSASNSPRRPELYGSPRSVAMEQKLMKSALESDGYWIGDFRVRTPAPPKRTMSMGASTPTKTSSTPKLTTAASFSSGSTSSSSSTATTSAAYRRTGSRAG